MTSHYITESHICIIIAWRLVWLNNWFSIAAVSLLAELAQVCVNWPITAGWIFGRRGLKATVVVSVKILFVCLTDPSTPNSSLRKLCRSLLTVWLFSDELWFFVGYYEILLCCYRRYMCEKSKVKGQIFLLEGRIGATGLYTVRSTENTVSQTCLFIIHHFCLLQVQDRPLHSVPFHQLVSLSSSWKTTTSKHALDDAGYPPGWSAFSSSITWVQRKLMDFIWWNKLQNWRLNSSPPEPEIKWSDGHFDDELWTNRLLWIFYGWMFLWSTWDDAALKTLFRCFVDKINLKCKYF